MPKRKKCPVPKKEADFLRALCLLDKEQRVLLLRRASSNLIRCICECALNILVGNVPLKPGEKKHLRKYANVLRKLADKRKINKKKIIVQTGGGAFLSSLLLPIVTTVLSNLLTN